MPQVMKSRQVFTQLKMQIKFSNMTELEPVQIDYDKIEGLESAFKGVDKLFLLTHPSSKTVEHESNLVTEAKKSGIKHIVKQSIMVSTWMLMWRLCACIGKQKN